MLFDKSVAMIETENNGTPYDTIVLFELKKPMREDLTSNNPVDQITDYMQKIKTNKVTDKYGRIIKADDPYAMVEEMIFNLRKAWNELNK